MPWSRKRVTPWTLPFEADGMPREVPFVIEVEPIEGAEALVADPIWRAAPLTRMARADVPRALGEAHRVRLPYEQPSAIVVKLTDNWSRGRLFSTAPERAQLDHTDRLLIVLADRVVPVHGKAIGRAFQVVADVYVGTHRRYLPASRR